MNGLKKVRPLGNREADTNQVLWSLDKAVIWGIVLSWIWGF